PFLGIPCYLPYPFSLTFLCCCLLFFFNNTATSEIYTLSLHDALPIFITQYTDKGWVRGQGIFNSYPPNFSTDYSKAIDSLSVPRSEEHTSELQSRENLVCRLLLEKKKEIEGHHVLGNRLKLSGAESRY